MSSDEEDFIQTPKKKNTCTILDSSDEEIKTKKEICNWSNKYSKEDLSSSDTEPKIVTPGRKGKNIIEEEEVDSFINIDEVALLQRINEDSLITPQRRRSSRILESSQSNSKKKSEYTKRRSLNYSADKNIEPTIAKRSKIVIDHNEYTDENEVDENEVDEMDDFIVADDDDIIEYNEEDGNNSADDSESVSNYPIGSKLLMSDVESDSDPMAYLQNFRTIDQKDAFNGYFQYLLCSMIDSNFIDELEKTRRSADSIYLINAVNRIESILSSRRQSMISNATWATEFSKDLHELPLYSWMNDSDYRDCEACGRSNHPATITVTLAGTRYNALSLYKKNWMTFFSNKKARRKQIQRTYHLGRHCYARTAVYSQLLHYKYLLIQVIQSKIQISSPNNLLDSILQDEDFVLTEYGRFKKVIENVDSFTTDDKHHAIEDVWYDIRKKVTKGRIDEFLSKEDKEKEDQEINESDLEQREKTNLVDEELDDDDQSELTDKQKNKKNRYENNVMLCLLCEKRPCNAVVLHEKSSHYFCCLQCVRAFQRMKKSCLICGQKITMVLPCYTLSKEEQQKVRNIV